MTANDPEPAPTGNDNRPSWELVMVDMVERHKMGIEKYGEPLQADNGRDPLVDAYQECLDQAVYLRTEMESRRLAKLRLEGMEFATVTAVLLELCQRGQVGAMSEILRVVKADMSAWRCLQICMREVHEEPA